MVTAFAQDRRHIGTAVNRKVWVLVFVSVNISIVEHSVVVVTTSFGVIHHAGEVRAHDVAHALTTVRSFLYIVAIRFPTTKKEYCRVLRWRAGIRVNRVEEVSTPCVSHVGTFVEVNVYIIVVTSHADGSFISSGVFKQECTGSQTYAQHFFCLSIAIKTRVFATRVSWVNPKFECAPILLSDFLSLGAAAKCH